MTTDFEIWEPRYHDRVVLLAKHRVKDNDVRVLFTRGTYKDMLGTVSAERVKSCPVESNGKIPCYAVPLDWVLE